MTDFEIGTKVAWRGTQGEIVQKLKGYEDAEARYLIRWDYGGEAWWGHENVAKMVAQAEVG